MGQSLHQLYVHLVFSTKNREPNILPRHRKELFAYIAGTLNALGCRALIVGGMADHVHMLFCQEATRALSDIVREIKTATTRWYKQQLRCNFSWQGGYGAFSVSQSKVDVVHNYIAMQEVHHRKKTYQEEYREFLDNYGIDYDERYVWE